MIKLGCIGYGAWGRNVARVADSTPGARLVAIAERDAAKRAKAQIRHPAVAVAEEGRELLADGELEAVLITSEASSHAALAVAAAEAGKHVFVEKPLALDPEGARRVQAAAEAAGVILQVGHLLRYHPAVEVLLSLAREELGPIRCIATQRLNFGTVRSDESVLFSLGPHDLSLMLALFGEMPDSVAAQGAAYVRDGVEDLAFVTLRFPGGGIGQMHLSWLDPHKVRRLTVVGEQRMAVFDDMEPREKVRIYDQGVDTTNGYWVYGENLALRAGDIRIPRFAATEPLAVELKHFVECVEKRRPPLTGAADGIAVIDVLHAAQRSLRAGGAPVRVG